MIAFTPCYRPFVQQAPKWWSLFFAGGLALWFSGCVLITDSGRKHAGEGTQAPAIDFKDPVLNQRKVVALAALNELTAREIILKLQYLDSLGTGPIDLYLKTDGGPIQDAFAVIDVMRTLRSRVNTWALGNCNSAGAMILVAGTGRRFAYPNAMIAIHGGKKVGRVPPAYLRIVDAQVQALWKQRAKLPGDWFPLRGDAMHFLPSEKALEYGVIDEIAKPQN